jgi:uncharacterized protein YwgA
MNEASVGWLMEHLGVSARAINDSFSARFRVQKAAFLLKRLGVRPFSNYGFGLYVHGPYSSTLASQYYSAKPGGPAELAPEIIRKLDWFVDHSDGWIELASAILSLKASNEGISDDDLLSTLRMSKPWVTNAAFESVLRELDSHGLVR